MRKLLLRPSTLLAVTTGIAIAVTFMLVASKNSLVSAWSDEGHPSIEMREIVDMAGRRVTVPVHIQRAASLLITSYERMLLLDQIEKMAMSMRVTSPWARTIFPEFSAAGDIEVKSAVNPNVEELVAKKVDVVFFWDRPAIIQKLAAAGIPVVVTQVPDQAQTDSFEAYKRNRKKDVLMHGQIFGPEAEKKAGAWSRYFDEKVDYVYSKTKDIPDGERPSVYYVRGPDVLTTHSKNSPTWWAMRVAGGMPRASGQTSDVIDRVPAEQFISWNLDVIFMGWLENTNLILKDQKWSKVPAVMNKKVFISPDGVFRWDHSSEVPLLIMFFAKKLYPDLFSDLDLVAETKYFYKTFYRYELTDDEADRILTHRPPGATK